MSACREQEQGCSPVLSCWLQEKAAVHRITGGILILLLDTTAAADGKGQGKPAKPAKPAYRL
jgi:hypothetical protein